MKKNAKILGATGFLLVIVIAVGIGKFVEKSSGERFSEGKEELDLNSVLMQIASQINQNAPMMLDSVTRLDSAVGVNKQFRYNYTIINSSAEELNPESFTEIMQPRLISLFCTIKETKIFINNGVPATYAYYYSNGKNLATITVHPSQCKSN